MFVPPTIEAISMRKKQVIGAMVLCMAFGAEAAEGDGLDVASGGPYVMMGPGADHSGSRRARGEPKANGPLYDNPAYGYHWSSSSHGATAGWVPPANVSMYDNPGYGPRGYAPSPHSGWRPPFNELVYDNPGYGPHPSRPLSGAWVPPASGPLYDNPAYGVGAHSGQTDRADLSIGGSGNRFLRSVRNAAEKNRRRVVAAE
jgi:hypothetical protein